MEMFVDMVLMGLLGITAVAIVFTRHLFTATMLAGAYSLTCAALFVNLDAVDVALTEAAIGAGISTVLLLGTLTLTRRREKAHKGFSWPPLAVVVVTGALLIYGTVDMPAFGESLSDHTIVAALSYIKSTWPDAIRERHDRMNADARRN